MKIKSVILLGAALLLGSTLFGQSSRDANMAPPQVVTQPSTTQTPNSQLPAAAPAATTTLGPMTVKEVISELKKEGPDQLQKDLNKRGVAFEMDPDIEKSLRKAKATDQVIQAVTSAGPKERAAAAKAAAMASGEVLITTEESADFKALESELDPDKAIAEAEAYVQKYPKSEVLSYTYAFEANAYQMKGDAGKIVECAEKSLDLKKDNLMSLLMAAYAIPTPQYLHNHQADEEKQLTTAEQYAQQAFAAIDNLKKQPNEQDADFAKRKAVYSSNLHADMGMIHLDRAQLGLMGLDKDELAKAEKEYTLAVTTTDHPDPTDYFRLGEAYRLEMKIDDAIAAFTKASEMGQGPVKQYAAQQVEMLKKAKAQAAAPAKP